MPMRVNPALNKLLSNLWRVSPSGVAMSAAKPVKWADDASPPDFLLCDGHLRPDVMVKPIPA